MFQIFANTAVNDSTVFSSWSLNSEDSFEDSESVQSQLQFDNVIEREGIMKPKYLRNSRLAQYNASSVPDIVNLSDEYKLPVVKEKKEFWEKLALQKETTSVVNSLKRNMATKHKYEVKATPSWKTEQHSKLSKNDMLSTYGSVDDLGLHSNDFNSLQYSSEDRAVVNHSTHLSLPNLSVKEKKYFWDQLHSRSSSSRNSKTNEKNIKLKETFCSKSGGAESSIGKTKEEEVNCTLDPENLYYKYQNHSLDYPIENYEIQSVQERKKMLFNQDSFKESQININRNVNKIFGEKLKLTPSFLTSSKRSQLSDVEQDKISTYIKN